MICDRCEGDGKAHGSDRPFEWSGSWTYPGPCPKCGGSGIINCCEGEQVQPEEYYGREVPN